MYRLPHVHTLKRSIRSLRGRPVPTTGDVLATLDQPPHDGEDQHQDDETGAQAIEGGHVNVTFASLVGIGKALGVKLAELLKGV